jgi:chitinase
MALRRSTPAALAVLLMIAIPAVGDDPPMAADFTRIANDGSELAAGALLGAGHRQWACLRDNRTGLVWEVKTADRGLRDRRWTFTPYDGDPLTNGGYPGYKDSTSGDCQRALMSGASCNTEAYIQALRKSSLCGFDDWRLPTMRELVAVSPQTSVAAPGSTVKLLPNTESGWYWSGANKSGPFNFSRVVLLPPGGSPTFYDGSYLVIAVQGDRIKRDY